MVYNLCQFEYGYEGQFYQLDNENGFLKFVDLNGNDMVLISPYGYYIVESNIPKPDCIIE